jgi:DNA-directed RNA polymerase subunit RPC12/RpoP
VKVYKCSTCGETFSENGKVIKFGDFPHKKEESSEDEVHSVYTYLHFCSNECMRKCEL